MTNPQTPQNPQGPPQATGEAPALPPFAPQPYPDQQAPQQYAQGRYPQQEYGQGQYPPYAPTPRPPRPARTLSERSAVPYGVGPFTLREAWFLAASVLVLLASFLPFVGGEYADVFGYASAWVPAPWLAIPAALVLAAAAALLVLRRLVPGRSFRVGSLSVDQFASAASVSTAGFYLGALFFLLGFPAWFGGGSQLLVPGAGVIVGLLFSLLAVVLTTLAPAIPLFRREFSGRREVAAHPAARPANAVPVRPRVERPAAPQQPTSHTGYPGQPGVPMQQAGPGEFAAYSRRGSQPAPAYDPAVTYPVAGDAAPSEPQRVTSEAPDVPPIVGTDAPEAPQTTAPDAPAAAQTVDPDIRAAHDADMSREPHTFAPGFVAADIPAVDPDGVAVVPGRSGEADRDDVIRDDEDRENADREAADRESAGANAGDSRSVDSGNVESAPVSAFSHVSAQAATTPAAHEPAEMASAETDAGGIERAVGERPEALTGENTTASTVAFLTQPFWVYSPVPRAVVDEQSGSTVFEIGPTAWALAIVDRGTELVIRHDDGRVGVLRDLSGITRG